MDLASTIRKMVCSDESWTIAEVRTVSTLVVDREGYDQDDLRSLPCLTCDLRAYDLLEIGSQFIQ